MRQISADEVERRLRAWAEVTRVSLELKRAALKKKYPAMSEQEIDSRVREHDLPYDEARNAE